jgi:hypothetical protein
VHDCVRNRLVKNSQAILNTEAGQIHQYGVTSRQWWFPVFRSCRFENRESSVRSPAPPREPEVLLASTVQLRTNLPMDHRIARPVRSSASSERIVHINGSARRAGCRSGGA